MLWRKYVRQLTQLLICFQRCFPGVQLMCWTLAWTGCSAMSWQVYHKVFCSFWEIEACIVGCLHKELLHSSHSPWVSDLPYYMVVSWYTSQRSSTASVGVKELPWWYLISQLVVMLCPTPTCKAREVSESGIFCLSCLVDWNFMREIHVHVPWTDAFLQQSPETWMKCFV